MTGARYFDAGVDQDGYIIVVGELSQRAAVMVRELLVHHSRGGFRPVRVDLSAADSVSGAAIAALVEACERAQASQTQCTLITAAGSPAYPVLMAAGLHITVEH